MGCCNPNNMTRQDPQHLLARKLQLERQAAADAELSGRLESVRLWQSHRLEQTYADLRHQSRFAAALDFFLSDLYGPEDFSRRDADLKRALGKLQRALPARLLDLLGMALELQVLTVELDQQLAAALPSTHIDMDSYAAAYRCVGREEDRRHQINLIVRIGHELAAIVRHRWIGLALRAAHNPARLAGFATLQQFLERGFEAFVRMGDAEELFGIIRQRETALMRSLLRADSTGRIAQNG